MSWATRRWEPNSSAEKIVWLGRSDFNLEQWGQNPSCCQLHHAPEGARTSNSRLRAEQESQRSVAPCAASTFSTSSKYCSSIAFASRSFFCRRIERGEVVGAVRLENRKVRRRRDRSTPGRAARAAPRGQAAQRPARSPSRDREARPPRERARRRTGGRRPGRSAVRWSFPRRARPGYARARRRPPGAEPWSARTTRRPSRPHRWHTPRAR